MVRTSIALILVGSVALACTDAPEPTSLSDIDFRAGVQPSDGPVELTAPVFGLGLNPDGSLVAASNPVGLVRIRKGQTHLVAELPGVSAVESIGGGNVLAVTGAPPEEGPPAPSARMLFRSSNGSTHQIADLGQFEEDMNPDQSWNPADPDSNPFGIAPLQGGKTLVSDAAGNDILIVDERGTVDWVAVLTPNPGIGAQPVATSITVGPDGAWYAGELTGFPGTPGFSRIWRIEAGTLHTVCPSSECVEVVSGLTSVMDLEFGPDGTLYVVEFDAAGWFAVEVASGGGPLLPVAGGTVKACDVGTGSCSVEASGLHLPAGIAVAKDGTIWVAENAAIPGTATVRALP